MKDEMKGLRTFFGRREEVRSSRDPLENFPIRDVERNLWFKRSKSIPSRTPRSIESLTERWTHVLEFDRGKWSD